MRNNIYQHRTLAKLSQQQLADLCDVSRQTINAIEKGKYSPSLELAFKLAHIFTIKVDDLFEPEN